MEELIKEVMLEATWWEHRLTPRQRKDIPMNEARAEVVEELTKKVLKKLLNVTYDPVLSTVNCPSCRKNDAINGSGNTYTCEHCEISWQLLEH